MEHHLKIARLLANLLDSQFSFLGFKFGLDPLIGLIPWIGDAISMVLSFYIIWIAKRLALPKEKINTMVRNLVTDFVLGLVPVLGDVADFFFRSNKMNLDILEAHLKTHPKIAPEAEVVG